jgi:hypothetical protein
MSGQTVATGSSMSSTITSRSIVLKIRQTFGAGDRRREGGRRSKDGLKYLASAGHVVLTETRRGRKETVGSGLL